MRSAQNSREERPTILPGLSTAYPSPLIVSTVQYTLVTICAVKFDIKYSAAAHRMYIFRTSLTVRLVSLKIASNDLSLMPA